MSDRVSDDHAIGVGMGGACPECNAPVDLGQEFCLECGAPIRARGPRRKRQAAAAGPAVAAAALAPPTGRKGFPWIPFLVVLSLLVVGVVFAMVGAQGGERSKDSSPKDDEGAISTLQSTPTSTTPTVTLENCAGTAAPGDGTETTFGATVPTLSTDPQPVTTTGISTGTVPTYSTPIATTPGMSTTPTSTAVTVDQNGNLCPAAGTATTPPATDPSTVPTTGTTATAGTTTPPSSSSGTTNLEWPDGKEGWTVILASYSQKSYTKADAQIRAAQAQGNGISSGVLDSNQFSSMADNLWVVFAGIFDTEAQAQAHQRETRSKGYQGSYVKPVRP